MGIYEKERCQPGRMRAKPSRVGQGGRAERFLNSFAIRAGNLRLYAKNLTLLVKCIAKFYV